MTIEHAGWKAVCDGTKTTTCPAAVHGGQEMNPGDLVKYLRRIGWHVDEVRRTYCPFHLPTRTESEQSNG